MHLARTDVGGWSMGGWISVKLALDHPEMGDRLVLYDSAGVYFPASEDADLFTPPGLAGMRRLAAMLYPHPTPDAGVFWTGSFAGDCSEWMGDPAEHGRDDGWPRFAGLSIAAD